MIHTALCTYLKIIIPYYSSQFYNIQKSINVFKPQGIQAFHGSENHNSPATTVWAEMEYLHAQVSSVGFLPFTFSQAK